MSNTIDTVARDTFGWDSLRPGQREAVESVVAGTDTLAVMPTGYGKSAIYQLAGVLLDGPTVVVSPLISLQFDQLAGLDEHPGAPDAVAVNSSQTEGKNSDAWQQIRSGDAEFVFLSPEQLAKEEVVQRLRGMGVRLFVVDEAHCVSTWGHDFRPDYLQLAGVIERLGRPTTLALTATGSPPVRDEIVRRLGMRDAAVMTRGFDRPNLRLEVVRHESDAQKRKAVVERLAQLERPGLAYVATRKDTQAYADEVAGRGIPARAYHAGQTASVRREVQQAFRDEDSSVVVATNAFGMGIDKPNVRFVLHAAVPDSLDSYYQEVGRAGRDGEPAVVELHYRAEDLGLRTFFASGIPARGDLRRAFEALASRNEPVPLQQLAAELQVAPRSLSRLTNLLQQAGVVTSSKRGLRARSGTDADAAVELAVESAEERERIEQSRIAMMRAYAETRQCRRQFLLGYFGEELAEPCGNCDTCSDGSALKEDSAQVADDEFAVDTTVRHTEWGDGTVMRTEDDRITVFFESEGYKVLSRTAVEENDLLKPA